jgi:hypothetical protein
VDLGRREAGRALLDEEAADLAVVGLRPDDCDVGDRAFVIHIFAPFRTQSEPSRRAWGAHRPGVGARVGLGEPEAADRLARVHRRQPALLLLLGAPAPDREHRQRALHGDGAADARIAGLELEAREAVGDGARAGSRSPRGACRRGRAWRAPGQLARQDALLEPVADVGKDALADEPAHRVADRALLVVEERVEREEVEWVELSRCLSCRRHGGILRRSRRE